jgi:DNA-binding winged helix-turn-helix (wHTH) protein/TolB-like protein
MPFRFGLFTFNPATQELVRDGHLVALEPQPSRALALLLSRAGEVVTREELRQVVWDAQTHVDFDRGLAYVLSQIRAALQDSASNPRFVQTIPRQGYKFIAPLQRPMPVEQPIWTRRRLVMAAAGTAAGLVGFALWPARPSRLAVSIFDNETGNPEFDGWVHSLADLVVTALTHLSPERLEIIGNAAPLRRPRNLRNLKALAKELPADYILLGQLQRQEPGLRFVTHLIRLPGETHLRARRLTGDATGLPVLETAVVGEYVRVVREHVLKLPPNSLIRNPVQS